MGPPYYVGAYLLQSVPDAKVQLFKDPSVLAARLATSHEYDILALSNYDWNINLDRQFLKAFKRSNPGIVTVMGGPNYNDNDEEWQKKFLKSFPYLDFYVTGEGEASFAKLVDVLSDLPAGGTLVEIASLGKGL